MNETLFKDKADVIIFPPLLYVGTLITGIIFSRIFPLFTFQKAFLPIAIALLLCGFFRLFITTKTLNKYKTTINPNGATTAIIKKGVFSRSRNPMYISFTLIYLGTTFLCNAWLSLLFLLPLLIIAKKITWKKNLVKNI